MKSDFEKICYSFAYVFAIVAYCIIVPVFVLMGTILYGVWRAYEWVMEVLRGE